MKPILQFLIFSMVLFIAPVANCQDTSVYKIKEEFTSKDETDRHSFTYDNMWMSISSTTIFVYDIDNYFNQGKTFGSSQAHYLLMISDGRVNDSAGINKTVDYSTIEEGDTLYAAEFFIDSMEGSAYFSKYMFLGMKREDVGMAYIESLEPIDVFPNPVDDKLFIVGIEERYDYTIYNIQGQAIIGGRGNNEAINTWMLKNGNYLLVINTKNKSYSTRFVKF